MCCGCCNETCHLITILLFVFAVFICVLVTAVFTFYWTMEWDNLFSSGLFSDGGSYIFITFIVSIIFLGLLFLISIDRVCCTLCHSCECNGCSYLYGCLALLDVIVVIVFLFLTQSIFSSYADKKFSEIAFDPTMSFEPFFKARVGLTPEEKQEFFGDDLFNRMFTTHANFFLAMGIITTIMYVGLCASPCFICC